MPVVAAECYFLDVGQGTCHVVLLGERRALDIDCGPAAARSVPLRLLKRYVDRICALVVSHNDEDHRGGAAAILAAFPCAIDHVFLLQDRPAGDNRLFEVLDTELRAGRLLSEPRHLICEGRGRVLYHDVESGIKLRLFSPTFWANQQAQAAGRPNATSAIVALECDGRRVVFPGDAGVDQWEALFARRNRRTLDCDVLAVPHHGGMIGPDMSSSEAIAAVYGRAVQPRFAVVSVGTSNTHGHPREEVVRALLQCHATVLCTQITTRCCDTLESLRPGVRTSDPPCRSTPHSDFTRGKNSRNVACAGTVIAEIGAETVSIRRLDAHQQGVDRLSERSSGHPLCRPREL